MILVEDVEASYVKGSRLQIKEIVVRRCFSKLVFLKFSKFQKKTADLQSLFISLVMFI